MISGNVYNISKLATYVICFVCSGSQC